jgi:GTP cyclohydrolase II
MHAQHTKSGAVMQTIRYNIVEKVIDVNLRNPNYPGFLMGAYKTNFSTWIAEHAIIYRTSLSELGDNPLVRINSACFTGDIFGDRRCECTEQLFSAMDLIKHEPGLIIYHFHHEGRGLGFSSKLMTYKRMQDEGISTFQAMHDLSNKNDFRNYGSAVLILQDLGIRRIRLITNNPNKKFILEHNGIEVVETVGLVIDRPELRSYLRTKQEEQGHFIDFDRVEIPTKNQDKEAK